MLFSGCTTKYYRERADKEVSGILQEAHQQVFGTNAPFLDSLTTLTDPDSISPEKLIEDRSTGAVRVVTIEDALYLAIHNSRRYSTEKERLYLTALTLSGERYAFQPHPFAAVTANFDRLSNGEKVGTLNSRLGFNQFLKTGGNLGLSIANDLLRYYTGDPRKSVISVLSANLAQPLLRGFGKYNAAVEALTQAERNVIYAVRDFNFFQQQYAVSIVSDYFNLLAQKDIVRNRYTNYLSRVQATERFVARLEGQRESPMNVGQTRQAELTARNNYINSVATYLNSLDQFKIELGLSID
jgi:hypothetical protein